MKIISGILILITVFFSFKHGWGALTMKPNPGEENMMTALGISRPVLYVVGLLTLAVGVLVLFPATFVAGSVNNAALNLLMLNLQLRAGNTKAALIEIPFLLMPLVIIWLGHPFKNQAIMG